MGLFLISLGLRPQLVAIGPLIPALQADLVISHAVAGLLGTVPVLCMGLFAPIGPWVARRLGAERAVAAGVGAIALLGLLRALGPEVSTVLALTFGIGLGVAIVGPVLPIIVRQRMAGRAAPATGIYAGGIVLGASLSAALAVPLAGPQLDWRIPLAVFSLATGASLIVWLVMERPSGAPAQPAPADLPRIPWTRREAWELAILFAAQSILFYSANAWLPTIYIERGWRDVDAGFLLALLNGMGLVATFGLALLAQRLGSRRQQMGASAAASLVALLGIAVLPDLALVWATLLGLGLGAVFPLVLTLPVDLADRAQDVGGLSAVMLFGGYIVASTSPFLLGLVRDSTGSFALSLWLLVGVAFLLLVACWMFVPARLGRRATPAASGSFDTQRR